MFPLQVKWGMGVGQVHSQTPPSYPRVTSLSSLLLNKSNIYKSLNFLDLLILLVLQIIKVSMF